MGKCAAAACHRQRIPCLFPCLFPLYLAEFSPMRRALLFVTPHAIAVSGDSVLYIAGTGGQRVVKYSRRAP